MERGHEQKIYRFLFNSVVYYLTLVAKLLEETELSDSFDSLIPIVPNTDSRGKFFLKYVSRQCG